MVGSGGMYGRIAGVGRLKLLMGQGTRLRLSGTARGRKVLCVYCVYVQYVAFHGVGLGVGIRNSGGWELGWIGRR